MRAVAREEILDVVTYDQQRPGVRARAMAAKEERRVSVGEVLTFLFENRETVRYQVQEMMRAERMIRESDIRHELDTYNELLGGPGELGCTLLIEVEDPAERDRCLRQWLDLPASAYVVLTDGRRVMASFDQRQVGEDRLSAVQFLRFDTGGETPVAVGVGLPALRHEVRLTPAQQNALQRDLQSLS